eukprot:scaffold16_cov242-Pinguiococcus_pyrenoidosus.AAC.13
MPAHAIGPMSSLPTARSLSVAGDRRLSGWVTRRAMRKRTPAADRESIEDKPSTAKAALMPASPVGDCS